MFIHYLITRVNIRVSAYGPEKMDSPDMNEDWLKERLSLFIRFCIPSVLEQTSKEFRWLIYFDPATPSFVFEKLNFLKTLANNIDFRFAENYDSMKNDIIDSIKNAPAPFVITSRLDNDDMISKHYVEDVHGVFKAQHNMIINFLKGYEYSFHDRVLRRWNRRPQNQFISLVEDRTASVIQSVYGFPHWKLPEDASVLNISGDPHWVYLRHELNYSSDKKNGIPCFTRPAGLKLFPDSMQHAKLSLPKTSVYALKWFRRMLLRRMKF